MKVVCEKCDHAQVCKLKAGFETLSKVAAELLKKEEAKDGFFDIHTECRCYKMNDPYLK